MSFDDFVTYLRDCLLTSWPISQKLRANAMSGLAVISTLLLAGCSLAPVIADYSIDYNATVETVTNNVLVTNILRARDQAPLYFSDLSQIRGSVQVNMQAQTNIPWGPFMGPSSLTRRTVQGGPLAINNQPGFDFAPLNTKNFAQGMLDGINVNVFAYFIQRGINASVFLNLVVSRVEEYKKVGDKDGDYQLFRTCALFRDPAQPKCLSDLLAQWTSDDTRQPVMGISSDSSSLGPAITKDEFVKDKNAITGIVQAQGAGIKVETAEDGKTIQLKKSSSKHVLCVVALTGGYQAIGITSPGATRAPSSPDIAKDDKACSKGDQTRRQTRSADGSKGHQTRGQTRSDWCNTETRCVLYLRSVEAVFYYLGYIVREPESSPIPFRIYDHPVDRPRFSVHYRGEDYYVSEASKPSEPDDYTITILAILNDLLNLNRDATEIPTTKAVATTP